MDEMLGNHYFLARNFARAAELLEKVLRVQSENKVLRRKLIICFAQIGEIDKALKIFLSLVKEDIDFIIHTDPVDDDCPCPELIFELERNKSNNIESIDFTLILGMFWLYCNLDKSVEYFQQAVRKDASNVTIKSILTLLEARLEKESNSV
jgi:tetratricopeptide (TPR) repeat protein